MRSKDEEQQHGKCSEENGWVFESLAGKLDGRRGVKRPLTKGCQFNQTNGNIILVFIQMLVV